MRSGSARFAMAGVSDERCISPPLMAPGSIGVRFSVGPFSSTGVVRTSVESASSIGTMTHSNTVP